MNHINEDFDLSNMSDIDYIDIFADIDQDAEIVNNFTNALRRDLYLTNTAIPDNFDVGGVDLIKIDDDCIVGKILTWDAEKVMHHFGLYRLFCSIILYPGKDGQIEFNRRIGLP